LSKYEDKARKLIAPNPAPIPANTTPKFNINVYYTLYVRSIRLKNLFLPNNDMEIFVENATIRRLAVCDAITIACRILYRKGNKVICYRDSRNNISLIYGNNKHFYM